MILFKAGRLPATILFSIISCTPSPKTLELVPGDSLPAFVAALAPKAGGQAELLWVFKDSECLGCQLVETAREIRGVQRRFGDEIRLRLLVALTSGREDWARGVVSGFLFQQRLQATVHFEPASRIAREMGPPVAPRLYLTVDGRVLHRAAQGAGGLTEAVEDVLSRGDPG